MLNNRNQAIPLNYCTGVHALDFYPFKEIKNWKNLGYWLLVLKPYIDKDNTDDGILESYSFSKENNSLEATVSLKATWLDGTPISSFEAAIGIAKGITFREIYPFVQVIGTEAINDQDWEKKNYKGIEIISPIKFRLYFESTIANTQGVLEDALSINSAGNIFWPIRINTLKSAEINPNYFDIISKYPIRIENGKYFITVLGNQVELSTLSKKNDSDFYFNTSDFIKNKLVNELKSDFIINKSQNMQTFFAAFNSNSIVFSSKEARLKIASTLRGIAALFAESNNYHITLGHFDTNEQGFYNEINWPCTIENFPNSIQEIKISSPYLSAKNKVLTKFEEYALKSGVTIKWIDTSQSAEDTLQSDIHIFIDRIQTNRQIWMQFLFQTKEMKKYLNNFTKTNKSIDNINIKSATTVPLDSNALVKFEQAAFDEVSIIPIFRYYLYSYTRKNSPIVLNISENKELYFSLNKN